MTEQSIKAKQALIQQLRRVAEKKSRLDSLIELRSASGGEITPEEQKLSKHVALYESRRSGMWDLAKEINQEEQNLKELRSKPQ
jgi:sulfur transfer protein SufE